MICLTKLFQQKRRKIGYILAFSAPTISKRDSSDIYMFIYLYRYCAICLLLYCMLIAWRYCFLYIYILFLFLTSTSIFLLLWLPSLYHLAFYGAKVWQFCQIPNTRRCLIRLKLFRNAFHKCCTFGFSKKLSTELFGVLPLGTTILNARKKAI